MNTNLRLNVSTLLVTALMKGDLKLLPRRVFIIRSQIGSFLIDDVKVGKGCIVTTQRNVGGINLQGFQT